MLQRMEANAESMHVLAQKLCRAMGIDIDGDDGSSLHSGLSAGSHTSSEMAGV
jgi:hypothetical protein